jgi:4-hydroxythreonine-4-phosphate dehydrogenase
MRRTPHTRSLPARRGEGDDQLPRLVISMGDPSGIGPEVTLKALAGRRSRGGARVILVGDPGVYEETAAWLKLRLRFVPWAPPDPLPASGLPVRVIAELRPRERRLGRPGVAGGKAAYDAIIEAVRLISEGFADALVTAPICKANLAAAGANVPGHTELLAKLSHTAEVRMMMVGSRLRVALVTTHLSIARLPASLSTRRVLDTITITQGALKRQFGIVQPRIAVTGLNPHAGEQGMFGDEEIRIIAPAVAQAARRGIKVVGPLAADGAFPHAMAGEYDAVVCMYHDQGLGPFKLVHFADGVNFTAGLPFVRTSPDHGTAHDIVGRGIADACSMVAALSLAAKLAAVMRHGS